MSEWFFLQQMKKRQSDGEDKEDKLSAIRIQIRDTLREESLLKNKLDTIPAKDRFGHPLRIEWIAARSKYWDLIAKMRDIERGKV
tara:strand:- start:2493 stop:2747 length:255 start_codon:yes stop_codon:yes gene_type:complete